MADYGGIQRGHVSILRGNVCAMPEAQHAIEENAVALFLPDGHEYTLFQGPRRVHWRNTER